LVGFSSCQAELGAVNAKGQLGSNLDSQFRQTSIQVVSDISSAIRVGQASCETNVILLGFPASLWLGAASSLVLRRIWGAEEAAVEALHETLHFLHLAQQAWNWLPAHRQVSSGVAAWSWPGGVKQSKNTHLLRQAKICYDNAGMFVWIALSRQER
jgi:hypothetical protein